MTMNNNRDELFVYQIIEKYTGKTVAVAVTEFAANTWIENYMKSYPVIKTQEIMDDEFSIIKTFLVI